MSIEEENKALVRKLLEEVWNKKNQDLIPELIAPEYILNIDRNKHEGPEGHKQVMNSCYQGLPDFHINIENIVGDGDIVVYYGTFEGTHEGEFVGVKPTGKHVIVKDCGVFQIKDGKIISEKGYSDMLGLMQQLGAIPSQ